MNVKKIFLCFSFLFFMFLFSCKETTVLVLTSSYNIDSSYVLRSNASFIEEVDYFDLKEKDFFVNMMNSKVKSSKKLEGKLPSLTLVLEETNDEKLIFKFYEEKNRLELSFEDKNYLVDVCKDDFNKLFSYFQNREEPIEKEKFKVEVNDKNNLLINNDILDEYEVGSKVTIYFNKVIDANLCVFVNGEEVELLEDIHNNIEVYKYSFYIYKDTTIEVKVRGVENLRVRDVLGIPDGIKVSKVRMETSAIGVAPGSLRKIKYSTNDLDIKNTLDLLNELVVLSPADDICGGRYISYQLFTDKQVYEVRLSNNFIYLSNHSNEEVYKFLGEIVDYNDCSSCYSFLTSASEYKIYSINGEFISKIYDLGEYEFEEIDNNYIDLSLYYIETNFGDIYLYDEKTFYFDNHFYRLTNGKKFNFDCKSNALISKPVISDRNIDLLINIINGKEDYFKADYVNVTPDFIIDNYNINLYETKDKSMVYLLDKDKVFRLYPFSSSGSRGVKEIAVYDTNGDGDEEVYILIDYGKNRIFNKLICYDIKTKSIFESNTFYNDIGYFAFDNDRLKVSDKIEIVKKERFFEFSSLEYDINGDTFDAKVTINLDTINFPVTFIDCENMSYSTQHKIIIKVETIYKGPNYNYTGSSTMYGAIPTLKSDKVSFKPMLCYTTDVINTIIKSGRKFVSEIEIFISDSEALTGLYDLVLIYNGENEVVMKALEIK